MNMVTDFTSIFHEEGFIFVNERSSYNRNGNREGIGATTADSYKRKKAKYSDPRNSEYRTGNDEIRYDENRVGNKKVRDNISKGKSRADKSIVRSMKTIDRNMKGSQKYVNADRNWTSMDNAKNDKRAMEKLGKRKAKNESAILGFDFI